MLRYNTRKRAVNAKGWLTKSSLIDGHMEQRAWTDNSEVHVVTLEFDRASAPTTLIVTHRISRALNPSVTVYSFDKLEPARAKFRSEAKL